LQAPDESGIPVGQPVDRIELSGESGHDGFIHRAAGATDIHLGKMEA
jgi:hypothetical protein